MSPPHTAEEGSEPSTRIRTGRQSDIGPQRPASAEQDRRRRRQKSDAGPRSSKPLPTPVPRPGQPSAGAEQQRAQIMAMFGQYTNPPESPMDGGQTSESTGSSQHLEFPSPTPPTSDGLPSSGESLPKLVYMSQPSLQRAREEIESPGRRRESVSAGGSSRADLPSGSEVRSIPRELSKQQGKPTGKELSERKKKKILNAYHNQFAQLLGYTPRTDIVGESPAISLISGESGTSPRTITLEDMQLASRLVPRNPVPAQGEAVEDSLVAQLRVARPEGSGAKGWSQPSTPSPGKDRDSGLFGRPFSLTSPPMNSTAGTPQRFEPIQELDEEGSWSQAVARRSGVTNLTIKPAMPFMNDESDSDTPDETLQPGNANEEEEQGLISGRRSRSGRPSYEVQVPPPERMVRTPTLLARSPTPTRMTEGSPVSPTRRRRATTMASDASRAERAGGRDHTRSRSFGESQGAPGTPFPETVIRRRSRTQSASEDRQPLLAGNASDELDVPLIPPPPPSSNMQFTDPFMGRDDDTQYFYEPPRPGDSESVTRTRIRRRRDQTAAGSPYSPQYTLASGYSPSYAESNATHELAFLGIHKLQSSMSDTRTGSPYQPSIRSHISHQSRQRASSMANDSAGQVNIAVITESSSSSSDGNSNGRRGHHRRSDSTGSRVSSMRDEIEQRQRPKPGEDLPPRSGSSQSGRAPKTPVLERWESILRETTRSPDKPVVAPGSAKVSEIREIIEEWQRSESPNPKARRQTDDSAITGTTALPPRAAGSQGSPQHFVGEIESVGKAGKTAHSESSSDGGRRKRETGIFGDYAGLSADTTDNSSPLSATDSPPRLVPLTPVPRRVGASSDRQKQPAAARSNTTTSRESRQSVGTALSSNVPPSLFGSDKSTFDTPLLSRLPAITVPSGVPSLYTINSTISGPEKHERGKSEDIQQQILESVRSAVASPVSIGGHKKQSLVIDPRTASNELLVGLQQVKVASPEIRSTPGSRASSDKSSSPIPAHVSTTKVLESPATNMPAATTAADRRDWARQRPNSRPPLATASDSSSSRPSAAAWEKKLRERAELAASTVQLSNLEVRPVVVASPANAMQPKTSGGLPSETPVKRYDKGRRDSAMSMGTPPVDPQVREEMVSQALAFLEGAQTPSGTTQAAKKPGRTPKVRRNRDPLQSARPSPSQSTGSQGSPLSVVPEEPSGSLSSRRRTEPVQASPTQTSIRPRPASQKMGRHGSSPLNPYAGDEAPPLPDYYQQSHPGLLQRIAGSLRRKRSQKQPTAEAAVQPLRAGGWWRNLRESILAPVPPLHNQRPDLVGLHWPNRLDAKHPLTAEQQQELAEAEAVVLAQVDPTVADQLPAKPSRRHSFSASTNMEDAKITATMSPRENFRRKLTMADRFRNAFRGARRRPGIAEPVSAAVVAAAAIDSAKPASPSARIGSPIGGVSVSLSPVVGLHPSNPFVGPRRRASIGVMSMHEMEGVEQSGLLNRLDDIVGNDSNHMHSPAAQSASIGDVSFDEIDAPPKLAAQNSAQSPATSFFFDPTEGKQDQVPPSKSLAGKPLPTPPAPKRSPPSKKTPSLDQHSVPKVFKSPVVQPTGNPSPVFTSSSGSGGGEVQQPNVKTPPVPPMRQAQQSKPEMQQVSRPEMQQRPQEPARQSPVGHSPVVQEPVSEKQPMQMPMVPSIQVNPVQIEPSPQSLAQQPLQQPIPSLAQQPVQPEILDRAKRPSFFKRLTAGWRKPPLPANPYDPIYPSAPGHTASHIPSQEQYEIELQQFQQGQYGQQGQQHQQQHGRPQRLTSTNPVSSAAVQGVAAAAAGGLATKLAQSVAGSKGDGNVPPVNVDVVHEQPSVAFAAAQNGHGSITESNQLIDTFTPESGLPTSQQHSVQQLPQQQSMAQTIGYGSYDPSFGQLPPEAQFPQNMNEQMPNAMPSFQQGSQYSASPPIPVPTSTIAPGGEAGENPSKFMSMVSAIPGVGKLFGGKKNKTKQEETQQQPPPRPDPSTNSYMSGSGSYMSGGPASPVADVSPPGDTGIMEKIVDLMDSFALPALILGAKSLVKRDIAPLVGRYAADYPLVEAEEEAGNASRPIRRGDPEEFKFAAPGLRYKDIDQRLENVVLRPFSKVRKFRRAPEVWDDTEALAIADKVKAHNNAARHAVNVERTRRTRSLGTAQNANNESLPNPGDLEAARGIDGHEGSGIRAIGSNARGLSGFLGRFGRGGQADDGTPRGRSRNNSLVYDGSKSPTAQGFTRSGDGDDEEEDDRSTSQPGRAPSDAAVHHKGPPVDKQQAPGLFKRMLGGIGQSSKQTTGDPNAGKLPPMFPPFSHLPARMADQIMHRIGEPRVFIGSLASQLVPPGKSSVFGDTSPFKSGSEWTFTESLKFSSPYPLRASQVVKHKKKWEEHGKRLGAPPTRSTIARWPAHFEIIRDFLQLIGLIVGAAGYTRAPVESSIGARWPWMIVSGIPKALGLEWADLSTTTGTSIGFFVVFCAIGLMCLGMWVFGSVVERTAAAKGEKDDGEDVGFENETTTGASILNPFGSMPKWKRMHILYLVLSTLYIPVLKLSLEAIVWDQGFWAVANPFRTTDKPSFPAPTAGYRDPSKFCYTTTMRNGAFSAAYILLPVGIVVFIGYGLYLPWQIKKLAHKHMPNVIGWDNGKSNVAFEDVAGPQPAVSPDGGATARRVHWDTEDMSRSVASDVQARDNTNPLMQHVGDMFDIDPTQIQQLGAAYQMFNGQMFEGNEGENFLPAVLNWVQNQWNGHGQEEDYSGMSQDEAYKARLGKLSSKNRKRHLATVQYRRRLDTDTSDYRFIYEAHYPYHAHQHAREMRWKLTAVLVAVILSKDNCWFRGHSRHSLDAGRSAMLLLVALMMLRSHHSHRPFFDPTANLSALFMRMGIVVVAIFGFPLFLMRDPLSTSHMGVAVTLSLINLCVLALLLWLGSSSLPKVKATIRGPSAPLTLSPGILTATTAYDPRLRKLLIERVWQDTWSAILLASRDFRLLPYHRVAFTTASAHPPYMVNYMGFAAERHLENLRMYEYIGRTAYCKAVAAERHNSERFKKTLQILAHFIGDDMYFNPFEANENQASVALKFGIDQGDVKSWFGRVFVVHFPFMVCMLYDDLPGRIVPIADERDLDLYITQNYNEEINRRRLARQQLRSLSGHYVTLTFIEHGGEHGGHSRYYLQGTEEEHQQYLQKYRGKRRILYRGMLDIQQEREWSNVVNVNTGFICTLKLTDQITVDDENLVNDFSIHNSPFRMSFWKTGRAGTMHRSSPSMSSSDAASLLGIDPWYSSPQLQALIAENRHVVNDHIDRVVGRAHMLQSRHRAEIKRKRTGMTPSFLIDVFSPGPESLHVVHPSPDETPVNPATPQITASDDWGKSSHGRLSYIPTLAQLQRKLSADEENKYVRDIMDEHRNDIQLLYERLRNLVPSEANDPLKSAWYLFWDDIYRRYALEVAQFKEFEQDFNPLYPHALPYNPLPRHKLEVFLYERGLWKPVRSVKGLFAGKKATVFPADPMPVEGYGHEGAHIWRAGDDEVVAMPFEPGTAATGFMHSGLLNRLYNWLDQLAYGQGMHF